jgi:hypothetical protein
MPQIYPIEWLLWPEEFSREVQAELLFASEGLGQIEDLFSDNKKI